MKSKNFGCMLLIILTVILASGILNGCAGTEGKGKKEGAGGSKAAKGRYVEKEVELPFGEGERGLNIAKTKEGNLVLFSSVENTEVNRYEYIEGSWMKSPLDWVLKVCKEGFYPLAVNETKDGVQFVIGKDDNGKTHILRSTDAKNGTELKIPYLEKKKEYGYPHIASFLVDDGGNYWLQDIYNSKVVVVSADTLEMIKEIKTRDSGSDSQELMFAGEDKTVAVNTEDGKYTVYNKDIEELGTFPYDGEENGQLCNDGKNWYMVTEEGIARMRIGDDSREVIMDGNMGAMGSPVNSSAGMVCKDEGEFYVLYMQWKTMTFSLARYVYDKDVAAVPEHTLQVFGLLESDTIRQAIVGFQRDNPNVKVEFNNSGKGAGEISSDDIRTLNTELLGGKGADVLLLNGLPADAYIEKGILTDLTKILKKLMKENAYLENIVKNTVQKDKKVYGIPVKFTVPIMFGDEQIEKALDSLMLCSLERDLEYDCENATFFWYSIYYGVINHTSEIPLAEPIEEDIRVPKMAVQEFASGLFRDYSDLPAIPKELSLVRYDENWDAYIFTPMPRGEIATRLLSASSFADGTIEAAAVLYNTQNDQPLFCGTFLLEENPYADGVTDAIFPYRVAEMKRSDAVNTPEELPACKGTYEGFSDNHTVEFKIDGNLMAFQVEDPQVHALLALLSEGSEISFVATTDAHTEVRTIVSILGE